MREQLGLGDIAELAAERGDARAEEVPGHQAERAVGEDVERRGAARVGPAGSAEEGEGAEDRGPDDEVEHQEAELRSPATYPSLLAEALRPEASPTHSERAR